MLAEATRHLHQRKRAINDSIANSICHLLPEKHMWPRWVPLTQWVCIISNSELEGSAAFIASGKPICPLFRERCCLISQSGQLQRNPEGHKKSVNLAHGGKSSKDQLSHLKIHSASGLVTLGKLISWCMCICNYKVSFMIECVLWRCHED